MNLSLPTLVAVGAGGALGAILRVAVGQWLAGPFPWATFTVNAVGSLLLGAVLALHEVRPVSQSVLAFVALGFCGSVTTFSTFSFQSFDLLRQGAHGQAMANILLNVVVCIGCVALAHWVARMTLQPS